LARWSWP